MPGEIGSQVINEPKQTEVSRINKEKASVGRPDLQAHLLFADNNFVVVRDRVIDKLKSPTDARWDFKKFQDASHAERHSTSTITTEEWKQRFSDSLNVNKNEQVTSLLKTLGVTEITPENMQHILDTYCNNESGIQKFVIDILNNKDIAQNLPLVERVASSMFGPTVSKDVITQILDLEGEINKAAAEDSLGTLAMKLADASMSPSQETTATLAKLKSLIETKQEESVNDTSQSPAATTSPESQETTPSGNAASLIDIGKGRESQQDFATIKEGNFPRDIKTIAVLADGHGTGGEIASSKAGEQFPAKLTELLKTNPAISIEDAIKQVIAGIDQDLSQQSGGTTFVAAIQLPDKVIIVNVGDSRAYRVSPDSSTIEQITKDHKWPGGGYKHDIMLSRALGDAKVKRTSNGEMTAEPDIFTVEPQKGETIILASDGLTGVVPDEEIKTLLAGKTPNEAVQALIASAKTKGNLNDNLSVNIIKIV